MAEYALVSPLAQVVSLRSDIDPTVQTKLGFHWLPVVRTVDIVSAGQVLDPPVTTVLADRVTITSTARAKTASELDADKEAVLNRFDALVLQVLFDHENRIRALESKAPITSAQFRAALKARL